MKLSDPWDPAWLRELRRLRGLSQSQVALLMGVRQPKVSAWENCAPSTGWVDPRGRRQFPVGTPNLATRVRLAQVLGVAVAPESLAEARAVASLTQKELAAAVGVTRSSVAQWERGSRRIPERLIPRVAAALNVSEQWVATQSWGLVAPV